ncbi:LamG domain-containing protein [Parabacteroides sp. OttesenSCG-928-B22]|nr:LamG domain-containing protein [Parabacteroides sp. OttesenSCG-928-B22]
MKTRRWSLLILATTMTVFFLSSCHKWGEWDPPSGNQVYPKLQLLSNLAFDTLEDVDAELFAYPEGNVPEVVYDDYLTNVLSLEGGYMRLASPLLNANLQLGGSFTFWLNVGRENEKGTLISLTGEDNQSALSIKGNGSIAFQSAAGNFSSDPGISALLTPDEWHYLAVIVHVDGYTIYVDGKEATDYVSTDFDFVNVKDFMMSSTHLYLGYDSSTPPEAIKLKDLKVYRNKVTAKEINVPVVKPPVSRPPVYMNTFDDLGTATIIGGGSLVTVDDPGFGQVFKNVTGGMRQNYLLLPSGVLSHSTETKEMSISMWVNAKEAGDSPVYMWSPLLTAYNKAPEGGNGAPMFALQYRGVLMINNNGWCDFTDAQNVAGANKVLHNATDWLADKKWHHYIATMTEKSAKVYFDGVLINEWEINGNAEGQSFAGLFEHGSAYTYICLGGNQAWTWGDPDPGFMFDDLAIYDFELTPNQISSIIKNK